MNSLRERVKAVAGGFRDVVKGWKAGMKRLVKADFFRHAVDENASDTDKRDARDNQTRNWLGHLIEVFHPAMIAFHEAELRTAQQDLAELSMDDDERAELATKRAEDRTVDKADDIVASVELSEKDQADYDRIMATVKAKLSQ